MIVGPHAATYDAYWNQADSKKSGSLGAYEASVFLKKSGLSEKVLGKAWDLSDPNGKGYLDKQAFCVALKLIALAQARQDLNVQNLTKETPPPKLGPVEIVSVGTDWAIPATEFAKYDQIYTSLQPVNGKLSGDKVKPVFINSTLPVDVLGRVWDLADIDKDGMLDREEFFLAMHLVYRALEKEPVPMVLPPNLIPPSKRSAATNLPMGLDLGLSAATPAAAQFPWVVSAAEKNKFDEMFKNADHDKDGFVNGGEIKDIFLQSGLPQNVLADIWTLCDSQAVGKLNPEQFALAMYLIQQKLKGVDPPSKLTPEMVPPSMRAPVHGVVSTVTDFSTQGMKELDMIQKQIDDIKSKKLLFEQEKAQKLADIKIRNGEVQGLQKELDMINGTVTKLETQKGEAQKKLDELDDKKSKMDSDVKDMQEKCEEEEKQITQLNEMIARSESTVKDQEQQLTELRDELNTLRRTEHELEQQVEAGRAQLSRLMQNISNTHGQISQTSAVAEALENDKAVLEEAILTYQKLLSGDKEAIEPDLSNLTHGQVHNGISMNGTDASHSGLNGSAITDDPFGSEDPFKNNDPFKGTPARPPPMKSQRDPFKNNDPFGNHDPFGQTSGSQAQSDMFGDLDVLGGSKSKTDPFGGSDPFGDSKKSGADPFAPFSVTNELTSPVNRGDPFGADPFNPNKSKAPPPRPSKSPVPSSGQRAKSPAPPVPLPPKQKKAPAPPRPPAPKPGAKSPIPNAASPMPPLDDPFAAFDPFSSSAPSSGRTSVNKNADAFGSDPFADFANFGSSSGGQESSKVESTWGTSDAWPSNTGNGSAWGSDTTGNEVLQLDGWGNNELSAEKEHWETLKKKQAQEQADYELALKLQQQESSA